MKIRGSQSHIITSRIKRLAAKIGFQGKQIHPILVASGWVSMYGAVTTRFDK